MCFSIFVLFPCILAVKSAVAPTHLLVTRVGPCYDEPQHAVSISELSITTQTYDSSLSGIVNVTQDISDGWKIKVTMQKCLDLRNKDSCDHFKSFFVVNNGCSDEDDDEQDLYGMLFHYVNPKLPPNRYRILDNRRSQHIPAVASIRINARNHNISIDQLCDPLECPIQAGVYKIVNYPFFTEDNYMTVYESKISTSVFGYIYKLDGYTANLQKILCVEAFLQLLYIREHNWVQNTEIHETTMGPLFSHESDD